MPHFVSQMQEIQIVSVYLQLSLHMYGLLYFGDYLAQTPNLLCIFVGDIMKMRLHEKIQQNFEHLTL